MMSIKKLRKAAAFTHNISWLLDLLVFLKTKMSASTICASLYYRLLRSTCSQSLVCSLMVLSDTQWGSWPVATLMALSATQKPSSLPTGEDGASKRPAFLWEAWLQSVRDKSFNFYFDLFLLS